MFDNVNWKDLRKQKISLINAIDKSFSEEEEDNLNGLLNFIDSFQDQAVDSGQYTSMQVFGFKS